MLVFCLFAALLSVSTFLPSLPVANDNNDDEDGGTNLFYITITFEFWNPIYYFGTSYYNNYYYYY